ncbi:MAG: penicillin-binding transpeptidase domain-containing protein [Actinocrinis sp.]
MLPRIEAATPGAAVRGLEPQTSKTYGGKVDGDAVEGNWNPEPDPEPYSPAEQTQHSYQQQFQQAYRAPSGPPRAPAQPLGSAALPAGMSVRGYDDYDDFDRYDDPSRGPERRPSRARRALFATTGVIVLVLVVGAGLVFSGKVSVLGLSAKAPVPTVGFSPSGADAGTDATQTGTAFLTAWENGGLKAASNITDDPATALDQLTQYKSALKVSGLTIQPGSATTAGWMTFNVSAQVGSPASAWNYSSGLATYSKQVNGYTRWFVKWQPNLMFTSLKAGQHLTLGTIPAVANKVVDRNGAEITSSNAPSLRGIVSALKKSAPPSDGTPGQEVQITDAKGAKVSKVAKISDPVSTGAVKTTIDLHAQAAAQTAVQRAPNSSMVVIQPSTGDILAVANNPANGLDTAMVGKYAPGSTFKTVTTALVLNKGVIKNLGQTWDCPKVLNADGITLHNSEQEGGAGQSFLWDFAQSCNNAFSRFGGSVSRSELVTTAHDYFGFNQPWDVGLGLPTVYGNVPNTSANSLAEELVGQDRITASPLMMASVAATVAAGSFKQPILVPGTAQVTATALPSGTDKNLKTLMRAVVTNGTLATAFSGLSGAYGKTGTAEVQGKTANSWTIAFKGDYAVGALAVGGNYGASTAGPEVKTLLKAVS